MKRRLSPLARRMFRQGQTGQTQVILAFGFVVLLGFVGIVTDVSLMFVRYSSLRRAVDAAAVAAAGQMRRAAPNDDDINNALILGGSEAEIEQRAINYAYARNIASVSLAARQFIELYGVSPENVIVDTCATTQLPDGTYFDPDLKCESVDANGLPQQPRKLVRVTAQIQSETIFLRLLGWGSVTLEASAISETAVLDVILIFDVSESMANQTSYETWEDAGISNIRYVPPRMQSGPPAIAVWEHDDPGGGWAAYDWENAWRTTLGRTQDILNGMPIYDSRLYTYNGGVITDVPNRNIAGQPREECRVRFFPAAGNAVPRIPDGTGEFEGYDDIWVQLNQYSTTYLGAGYPTYYDGFVGTYNYFGCCNDPSGDFVFDDLICEPMAKVRNATIQFLDHIDFNRGDRVGFVTFDRSAYLIDPDGTTGGDPDNPGVETHMIDTQAVAERTLESVVGVRAEPNFYADTNEDGYWDSFVTGGAPYGEGGTAITYDNGAGYGYDVTQLGALRDYPVKENCYYWNAALRDPYSFFASPTNAYPQRYPTALSGSLPGDPTASFMWPPLNSLEWEAVMPGTESESRDVLKGFYSYELRAGCRGSNMGAALRVANNALADEDTIRTNGAVWVMVMLGDGAAAGTDPVRRNTFPLPQSNPYTAPYSADPLLNLPPARGEYGAFGACPYGMPGYVNGEGGLGALVDNDPSGSWSRLFPYCMDTDLDGEDYAPTRHFCFDPRIRDDFGVYIDLDKCASTTDSLYYDADDYARDWADFIGLIDPFPDLVTADQLNRADTQVPTIFTIGFGLDFQKAPHTCADNLGDCLGEELLRYIADVGDNNRIDTDYQQDCRDNSNCGDLSLPDEEYGVRGPCEEPDPNHGVAPMPPGESCGNYFNAPDERQLQEVFDTIASRMFTRLTR